MYLLVLSTDSHAYQDTASMSTFQPGIDKNKMYETVLEQCDTLFEDQTNFVSPLQLSFALISFRNT